MAVRLASRCNLPGRLLTERSTSWHLEEAPNQDNCKGNPLDGMHASFSQGTGPMVVTNSRHGAHRVLQLKRSAH